MGQEGHRARRIQPPPFGGYRFAGPVFVADRSNNRIQIFDQDGKILDQWTQFGGDSSLTILPDDTLYAVDTYKYKAVFIGDAKTGKVLAKFTDLSIAEGLAVDPVSRTLYTGEVRPDKIGDMPTGSTVRKLVRQKPVSAGQ